jgi:uncharacterized protein YjbI with pentapeptide repeats
VIDFEDGLSDVEVRGEVLTGADLTKLRATGSTLIDCELSGASLAQSDLWRVELRGCRMSGVVLDAARLRDVRIVGCKLDTASLRSLRAERVTFDDCVLREADLSDSRWKDSAILGCDLDAAIVTGADLRGTRVHGSSVDRVVGADSLRGIVIAEDQAIALGLRVLDALGITVEDDPAD